MKKNRGAEYLRSREAKMAMELEERSERKIEALYCDVVSRILVMKLEGPKETRFRSVPVGWKC